MIRTALKGVIAHRLRLTLTAISIVLGVAFVAGTYVFTDTISGGFDDLFNGVYSQIDVSVRQVGSDSGFETGKIPETIVSDLAALDVVAESEGEIWGMSQIISPSGEPIGGQGPPTLGGSWVTSEYLSCFRIDEGDGRPPTSPQEVLIDAATARNHGFELGDSIQVSTLSGASSYELVGIASFGEADSMMGATAAVWDFETAQTLLGLEGYVTEISVRAIEGVTPEELRDAISLALPDGYEAITGQARSDEVTAAFAEEMGFVNTALLAFAAVAMFVGGFIIQNTFRIVVAQRTRELALMRAIGARRSQIIWLVIIEAAAVALISSALGVAAGVGLASILQSGLVNSFGMPSSDLVLIPRTIIVAMSVGLTATIVSALLPAIKASRVPPVAAMSEHEYRVPKAALRTRGIASAIVITLSVAVLMVGLFGDFGSATVMVLVGSLGLFMGISILAPLLAAPIGKTVGHAFRGITGKLARENTGRQPRRTAATASALMIGVALVSFVAIFGESFKQQMAGVLEESFPTDLAFQGAGFEAGVSSTAVDILGNMDEVEVVSPIAQGLLEVNNSDAMMIAVDPDTIGEVYFMDASGDESLLWESVFIHDEFARNHGIEIGDTVDLTFWNGESVPTLVTGTFSDSTFADVVIPMDTYREHHHSPYYFIAFANLKEGVSLSDGEAAAHMALAEFPSITIRTQDAQAQEWENQIEMMVGLFSALLGLAIVIGLLGIANTLALSVVERTREIGLLRAVGLGRRQLRRLVRQEAFIVSVFGAILGIVVGTGLGIAIVASLRDQGLSVIAIPFGSLLVWLLVSAAGGIIASLLPARKAARMDILEAIAYQ